MELYKRLTWEPVRGPLFLNSFNANLEYNNAFSILEYNKHLSSLLGMIAQYPDIMKSFFPQTRMYYQDENVHELNPNGAETLFDTFDYGEDAVSQVKFAKK